MLETRILSPVAKVFPNEAPEAVAPRFSGLNNEVISFQLAYRNTVPGSSIERRRMYMEIESPIKESIHVRRVKYVPVRMGAFTNRDAGATSCWMR